MRVDIRDDRFDGETSSSWRERSSLTIPEAKLDVVAEEVTSSDAPRVRRDVLLCRRGRELADALLEEVASDFRPVRDDDDARLKLAREERGLELPAESASVYLPLEEALLARRLWLVEPTCSR